MESTQCRKLKAIEKEKEEKVEVNRILYHSLIITLNILVFMPSKVSTYIFFSSQSGTR